MQKKKGISLIVLVITIIVMIILATTIILAINNNNVVDKAKDAVTETNYRQVQELAQVAWAEGYVSGKRTQEELEDYVKESLIGSGISEAEQDKYNIEVTTTGVSVKLIIAGGMNEYGFYFGKSYYYVNEYDTKTSIVFYEDGVEMYADGEFVTFLPVEKDTYGNKTISLDDSVAVVSDDGLTISIPDYSIDYICESDSNYQLDSGNIYYASTYITEPDGVSGVINFILNEDGSGYYSYTRTDVAMSPIEYTYNEGYFIYDINKHTFTNSDGTFYGYWSHDGKLVYAVKDNAGWSASLAE